MNRVRNCILIAGLCAIALGLFLSKRPDEPSLRLHNQDCIDPTSPALDGLPASVSFLVQPDRLSLRHSGEVHL